MSRRVLTLCISAMLLTGCVASTPGFEFALESTDVDPASTPGFLNEQQTSDDAISVDDLEEIGVDPASLRYQGAWEGLDVYLGVTGTSTVNIITGLPGDPDTWGRSNSVGNSVMSLDLGDGTGLQYLPQGTADAPDGWTALSDWVIVLG